jgi:hypothetical protein
MAIMRNVYKIVLRKSEGKRPRDRPRHRGEDVMKVDVKMK